MNQHRTIRQLRADAQAIFWAGIEAVDAQKAVARHLSLDDDGILRIGIFVFLFRTLEGPSLWVQARLRRQWRLPLKELSHRVSCPRDW